MGSRDQASADTPASFTVTLTLKVEDAGQLWAAAAERALAAPGMTLADVLDTLGPREDPSIADCIAMLTAPAAVPGCTLEGYAVREAPTPVSGPAQVVQMPEPAIPLRPVANG
ncbi:MAG: hypothetical protein J7500_13650 [Sphingomonas sp.]|uniref:hypothetical protein n=1 Tax=Sphingomonas sp. TaxID=28214 RepID=UPI001B087710|nr:hypothetical protein [Sphingomonas sp.]MBO9623746.1 hypothetical protein [Sphingomonas sp.]